MKKIFALLIIVVVAASCEQEIVLDIPPQPVKLVVNGVIRTSTAFRVTVSKTTGVLDTLSPQGSIVNNALVYLYQNNVAIDTLVYNAASGAYLVKANTRAVSGNTYLLKASAPGFTAVEGTSTAPFNTPIQSITRRINVRKDAGGNFLDEVKITFTDDAAAVNYYMFRVRQPQYRGGNNVSYGNIYCMHSTDRDIEGRESGDPTEFESCIDEEFFLRDINFNGKAKEVVLFIRHSDLQPVPLNVNRDVKAVVELHSITADQYRYRKSLNTYRDAEDNPFAEPVLIHGNIKNGYGVFLTYDLARDTIR
ncbi:MAG TPA: DUF4249 domain-containing protein [Flavisolibacter sp.]|nr:DUF4249 domain-containing protein [Flavisolibacter sp.]